MRHKHTEAAQQDYNKNCANARQWDSVTDPQYCNQNQEIL
jgi:hypothetical protein